ncbi:MAG TPA: PKD domain-containing protein, partial [Burkholderiales bacterium]
MRSNRMSSILSSLRGPLGQVLAIALLTMAAGGAHASGSRGTQLDNYCATKAPASSPPQQSRPYRASNSSCALCHPNGQNTASSLNTLGRAVDPCSGSGALATACQATTDPFCINTAPRSEAITQPTGNVSVGTGTAVNFQGTAIDPDGFPLTFTWRFSNGLPDVNTTGTAVSTAQTSATSVTFLNAGTVTTTLQVRDANQGLAPTQPTRQVTVTAPVNQAPNGTIDSPAANASVVQGGTVNFQGTGTDPENSALTYLWNFGGGAPNSTLQDPGNVTFNTTGTFNVTFTVTDAQGLADPSPATRTVTVTAPPALAISPTSVSVTVGSTAISTASNAVGAVTATSANPAIATASVSGSVVTVAGVAAGSTTVAVRDSRTNAVTQTLNITVTALPLAISPNSVSVVIGGSATSTVSNAVGSITASSANTSIATASVVNNTVLVSGVAAGSTTVTVRDSRTVTQTLSVTVTAPVLVGCRDNDRDGYSPDGGACGPRDCNDSNANVHPGAREVCGDGLDNDCDGQTDSADRECNGTDCLAQFFARPVVITNASWEG